MTRQPFRKARLMVLSPRLWRKRLVFWCGALLVGVVSSYFAVAVDGVNQIFNHWIVPHTLLPLLITPLVFALSAGITRRFFPAARGSGIPQAIAARVLRDDDSRRRLLGMRVAVAKMLLTLLGLLGGASIGREGPTVQIGAAIMLLCASFGGVSAQRGIVLAGAAAGVAAAFNTPLAGIIFAIEEMARAFEHRNSSVVLIAIVLSGAAAMSILGNYDYFGYTDTALSLDNNWQAVLAIGVAGGLMGGLFARLLIDGETWLRHSFGQLGHRRPVVFAAFCGLAVASIGIATDGLTFGSGYGMGHDLLHGGMAAAWWQMPAKLTATALSTISGIPGGIFSPSLSVGAALGGEMAQWFPHTAVQGAVILAMVAYFAGVTQAPITAFVIVLEITGKATDAVPLIATAVIAAGIGRMICPVSLYHSLAKFFTMQEG
ncbi:MAG: chloride channel protein [Pseudomonadota bacterium]|nr:chloride channel protein [Pseudomonadota bacterium]MDE3037795.1 chloride channel protein [Pseudomonadota bacterium]